MNNDNIIEEGMKFTLRDTKETYRNANLLVTKAENFLKKLNNIVQSYNHTYQLFETTSLQNINEVMRRDESKLQEIIQAQYGFETDVNNFLGRSINFAWVSPKGQVFFADQISAEQIYQKATLQTSQEKKGSGQVIMNLSLQEEIMNKPSFIKKEYQKEINQRIQNHQQLYQNIIKRLNENLNKQNKPWAQEFPSTVYWKLPPQGATISEKYKKWTWSHTVSRGDIAEGYVNFIFNTKRTTILPFTDKGIGTFMNKWVQLHNSIPGIVKGDIIIKGTDEKIQIAVKSSDIFNTASIGPYLRVAYKIITFSNKLNKLTLQELKNILKNTYRYSERIAKEGQQYLKEKLDKEINIQ